MIFYNELGEMVFSIPDLNVISCTVDQAVKAPFSGHCEACFTLIDDETCKILNFLNHFESYNKFCITLDNKILSNCHLRKVSNFLVNGFRREIEMTISFERFEFLNPNEHKAISQFVVTYEGMTDQRKKEVSKLDKAINAIADFMKSSETEG